MTLSSLSLRLLGAVALPLSVLPACASFAPPVLPSVGPPPDLADVYASAFQAEALDSTSAAAYLDLVDLAVAHPEAPGALPATFAAIGALVTGSIPGFEGTGEEGVAFRSRQGFTTIGDRLRRAWSSSETAPPSPTLPFLRGAVALALHELSLFSGDVAAAHTWAARRGGIAAATVVGPLDWTPLRALEDPSPIAARTPLANSYPGIAPFAAAVTPSVIHADACQLDVAVTSTLQGTRAVVVDLAVPRAETIHLALTTSSAAVVDVGGVRALRRGFEAGGKPVMRLASVTIPAAGWVRVVMRVAQKGDSGPVELDAWGEDGQPLASSAPAPGAAADVLAGSAASVEIAPSPKRLTLAAAGLLALGEARAAEHLLEPAGQVAARAPGTELLYARAVEVADDLPDNKMAERVRDAVERALAAWPSSWEARVGHARIVERRRGAGEGTTEALRTLGAVPNSAYVENAGDPMVAAYVALTAKRTQLPDVAEAAYDELAREAPGAPLLAAIDARLHARSGAEAVVAACQGGLRRADTDCFDAHRDRGEYDAAIADLQRLRQLRDAPDGLRDLELSTRILAGDVQGGLALYDSLDPGDRRMLEVLGLAAGSTGGAREARARLARDRLSAKDSPYSLAALVRALGVEADPAPHLEEEGRKLVLADQRAAFLPGAGTAVLRHVERYGIEARGLVHFLQYDLRRVSGTTDVAQGAISFSAAIEGRAAPRLLRKRIHKRDGRVLEPDAAANASQASDLSQLEQGDYVEQISEGWALPGDTGQILIDTADLLPERTSVREAIIEVRRAASVPLTIWAHPLLGAPEEKTDGDYKVSVWRLKDQSPRRIEDGVPKMERGVSVSLGTQTWPQIARAFEETIRSLDEHDPYVVRWVGEAAGNDRRPGKQLINRIVIAAGKAIKVAGGGDLSDIAAVYGGGSQRITARTILEQGQGSRSWVIFRALRELGISADLAVAEIEPFSAVASFPPHIGRFRHPLVVAHLGAGNDGPARGADGDVWIDADVEGPPLPPGRISPELRGRTAMLDTGTLVTVEGTASEAGDEVDVHLALDDGGDARGNFTVLLHGRAAQALAELFETVVGTERRGMLRGVVLGWMPWADVDEVTVSSSEGSWEVALRATIAVHGFGRLEGKDGRTWVLAGLEPVHVVFPRAAVGTLGQSYASRGARQNALSIEQPLQYHFHRRIDLPAGASVVRAPATVEVVDPNISARRKITHKGQTLEEDFTLSLPTGTVAAGRYQAFVEKVQTIDDGFMAGTRIHAGSPAFIHEGAASGPKPRAPAEPGGPRVK
jgi:hypothetical protein